MTPEQHFRNLLRARSPLFWVVTGEERRAERQMATAAATLGYQVRYWDCATGAVDMEGNAVDIGQPAGIPTQVFDAVRKRTKRELWIMRDLHDQWLSDPICVRSLKSLARDLQDEIDSDKIAAVVVLSPSSEVPPTLLSSAVVLDWPLPDRAQIGRILDDIVRASGKTIRGERETAIDAAAGLAADDVANAMSYSLVAHGAICPEEVARQKKLVIDREGGVTWFEREERGLDAVGGLALLKDWLSERRLALSQDARDFGLPAPKGILLAGIPGNGKSLVAKAMPTAWGLPLLRLDLGSLRGSLVGQSEQAIRRALKVAEAVAPVVLWLDEVEKALAGSDSRGDGGVAADALATILTWLQERAGSVFVVATANDVAALPAEFSRKGRFDEVFFIDLPTLSERVEILAATLHKHARDPEAIEGLDQVAAASDGLSGAEVAELVPAALFAAYSQGKRPLTVEDLLAARASTIPMSESQADKIDALRAWSKHRARPASAPETERRRPVAAASSSGFARPLDLQPEEEH
jgi:hypothetical protein